MASGTVDTDSLPSNIPTAFEKPSAELNLTHCLQLNIPLPSRFHAETIYRVLRVDKPLRPKDTHIAFCITSKDDSKTITSLNIQLYTSTVRQMRLSSNAILDDVTLVLETMEAFSNDNDPDSTIVQYQTKEEEFELNGVGRAG